MALATLSIDLVAQLASLQQGMDKAGRLAEKQASEIEARYARMAEGARAVGAALAGAISVAGLTAFFRATVDGLDALNDVADATGATIENISALEDIAARTGTQMEVVTDALLKMNKVLSDAKPSSELARTLESIGLSVDDLKQADPAEALRQVAEALSGYADDGEKARLVQELFGKSTKQASAFLKDLAEQTQLHATATSEQAAEVDKFNKQMFEFQKNITDGARAIVSEMLPALNQFFERLRSVNSAGGLFTSITKELRASVVGDELKRVVAEIESIQSTINRQGGSALLEKRLAGLRVEASALSKESAELAGWLKKFAQTSDPFTPGDAGAGRGFVNPPMVRPSVPGLPADTKPTRAPVTGLARQQLPGNDPIRVEALRAIEGTDTAKIERLKAVLQDLLTIAPEGAPPAVSQAIDDIVQQIAKLDPASQAAAESVKRIEAALAATPSARKADARSRVDELQAALQQTSDPQRVRQLQEAIDAIYEGIGAIPEIAEPTFAKLDEFTANFAKNVQQTFGDTIFGSLTGNFDNIGKAWGTMLLRMASDALAADLTSALFPGVKTGGGSSLGGLISGLGSLFTGSIFGGGRATGGGVRPGGIYSVVEQGPELLQVGDKTMLLTGKRGGSVIPASNASGGGGGAAPVVVNLVNNFASGVSRQEMAAYGQVIKQQTMAAVADAQRRGRNMQGA